MRSAFAILAACLLQIGCRQNPYIDASIELMNAERRGLEDRLYDLEYEHETTIKELEAMRRENSQLRGRLGPSGAEPPPPRGSGSAASPSDREDAIDDTDLIPPEIFVPPAMNGPQRAPQNASPPADPSAKIGPRDKEITHVALARRSLSGVDFDARPGDDGLSIVVEPRNAADEIVAAPGPITVVVLDYAYQGQQSSKAQVARWDLAQSDVERFLEESPPDEGIQLHLFWPEHAPEHERLRVHVRYHTADGRRLESQEDVRVQLAPRLTQRWTPRSEPPAGILTADRPQFAKPNEKSEPIAVPQWTPFR
jgi:hypothetical protein